MLRDLQSKPEPAVSRPAQVAPAINSDSPSIVRPCFVTPETTNGSLETMPQSQRSSRGSAPTIKAVKYNAPLTDLSFPDSETSETASDSAFAPAKIADGDRAALGQWLTNAFGALVHDPVGVAKSAAAGALRDEPPSKSPAKQATEPVAQRDSSVAPRTVPTPLGTSVLATDESDETTSEKTSEKLGEKATEKPADREKPAVTAAAPDDGLVTDENEKPAATATATDKTATDKAATDKAAKPSTPAVTAAAPIATAAAKPLDVKPSTAAALPTAASPAVLPPAVLSEPISPAPAPVVRARELLSPEMVALSQKLRYALTMYQHQRLLNTGTNVPWEVMHRFVAYGAATEVLRDGPYGEPVNAIGWLLWGGRCKSQPVLVLSGDRPMAMVGVGVQGHSGQFLGMLAQSRVRADSPFELQGRHFTVRDLIEQEKLGCEANTELTFELIAMSYYLKSDDVWIARTGEQWSIPRLIQEEIKQPIQGAACGGSHRLFGLSAAYKMRIAEGKPVDGEFLRAQKYIRAYQSYALGTIHNRDGSFSTDWFRRPADSGDLDRKIQTTGHILEWLVFSLDDNQLRDPRVVQSVDFLATQIATHPDKAWSIGPLGHALHALAIYQTRVFVQPQSTQGQVTAKPRPITTPALKPAPVVQPLPPVQPQTMAPRPTLPRQQAIMPPHPKADPVRPVLRSPVHPTVGTPNAAAATAELEGPDLGLTR